MSYTVTLGRGLGNQRFPKDRAKNQGLGMRSREASPRQPRITTLKGDRSANSPLRPGQLLCNPPRRRVPEFRKGEDAAAGHWLASRFQEAAGKSVQCWRQRMLRARGWASEAPESPLPAGDLGARRGRSGDPPSAWTLSSRASLSAFNRLKLIFIW